jgi:hypothetical protein
MLQIVAVAAIRSICRAPDARRRPRDVITARHADHGVFHDFVIYAMIHPHAIVACPATARNARP